MKYKVYNEDKLTLLGQDAVTLLMHQLIDNNIIDYYCNILDRLEEFTNDECMKKIDSTTQEYVWFHLVAFGAAILKIGALKYIKRKKFFGGYDENSVGAVCFRKGLESALENLIQKGNISNLSTIKVDVLSDKPTYTYGDKLGSIPIPYFYKHDINEIIDEFALNIASIRHPKKLNGAFFAFETASKEVVEPCIKILDGFFIA